MLEARSESEVEAEFITQVLGQALGYVLFSSGASQWNLQPKYSVEDGVADAAIGLFGGYDAPPPRVLVELKGPTANVDRDRSNGRTPVQQCWDYLNAVPACPWGIVCNYVSFRLFHRSLTPGAYELFVLQELREKTKFRQFYYLLGRYGLLPGLYGRPPHADALLESAGKLQREVGDELYKDYHRNRVELVQHLMGEPHHKSLETAIAIAQKLLDRIIFVAFCEDRALLPSETIHTAFANTAPFHKVTNPRWQNFRELFRSIDKGNEAANISAFNGGLFRDDPEVDNLELDDTWTYFFNSIGSYDFRHEVNVDVLGRIFEKSVGDIGKLRLGGIFQAKPADEPKPKMEKSAERKRGGIYYTPPEFTAFIVDHTVTRVATERLSAISKQYGIDTGGLKVHEKDPQVLAYCRSRVEALRNIKVIDPACGSGAFLIKAYDALEDAYLSVVDDLSYQYEEDARALKETVPGYILRDNLFGVDLSPQGVEITQLALWIRSAEEGKTLADLSSNIVCGNSLVTDPDVDPNAMNWSTTFPAVFDRKESGFDCVIGNPPWERMKMQEREFFDVAAPEIATAEDAATRAKLIRALVKSNPGLTERCVAAHEAADKTLRHVRRSGRFPLTGKGDINTYALFAELAHTIVARCGRVGILVPSGIATEHTTKDFFGELTRTAALAGLYDFENHAPIFQDVHRSFKFCVLLFGGASASRADADFVFFAHDMLELRDKNRHISLEPADFALLNPNTRTCPVFRSVRDAEITKGIYRRVPVLWAKREDGDVNAWRVRFQRLFDQTNDAGEFLTATELKARGCTVKGNVWHRRKDAFLPLYEAKMFRPYDHRFGSVYVKKENWMNQGQTTETTLVQHQDPVFVVQPRWWASQKTILERLGRSDAPALIGFRDVTRATDSRTMLASFIPLSGMINTAPVISFDEAPPARLQCCLVANLNSFVLDYVTRQKIGHIHLNFFIVEQLPVLPPDTYSDRCPWEKSKTLERWISERVLKLSCTSNDMVPLAKAAGFKELVHKWKPDERAQLLAELDAAYLLLYGIKRDDAEYMLSTFSGSADSLPELFGNTSTKDLVLTHYDRLKLQASRVPPPLP